MWATTIKAGLELHTMEKDWEKVLSELAQDRRAWSDSIRDVVSSNGDAGSTRPV